MELPDPTDHRFIPITSDYGFKVTFGNEANTLFLRQALQALIKSPIPIANVIFDKNTLEGYTADSRSGVYDISCTDEAGNQFIVEMQLSDYPQFLQRMKFYALYKFNTLVKKGDYSFENLPRIYCVGILKKSIFPHLADYHTISTLRTEKGEQTDDQLSFITVELDKFKKKPASIKTDLDKLLYTMKTLHKVKSKRQFPAFWNEEWLKTAILEVDRSAMSTEKRLAYEMLIAQNAAVVHNEKKKMAQLIEKMLRRGKATVGEIAEDCDVSIDFVLAVQEQLSNK